MRRLGVKAALVDGHLVEGDLGVADGTVAAVGLQPAGRTGLAVPGFVDAHVNGFAGVDFLAADAEGYARAGAALAATGVVAYQPTFITSPVDRYAAALAQVAALDGLAGPRPIGVHLEGPFISERWVGAHDPAHLLAPDVEVAGRLCDAGPVTMVTLAPELPGALELVERLTARGVVVSCGHSDADAAAAHAAYNRGARAVTHVYNAQRRWSPRDPGLAGVALVRGGVTVMAIVDLVHLAPEAALAACRLTGERFCLVTDAIEATGLGPGRYRLGDRTVLVDGGQARLADGRLAGAVLTMDQAVRNLVQLGVELGEAVHAATRAPARLLKRADLGRLGPGTPAHLAVLDESLHVARTLVGGEECHAA
ncbi:MAG TPA: N-acetylglucosamine-6-phosphate deacetylase [Solirubrobacteraceae bacterium]|jgi:N-acetylglucosamine-6-phosphate deacetylase